MARTQEERRTETRTQLLAAAADLFAMKGYHATTAEAVADAAGRTTGALYDHFGGKQGLMVALLELWIGQTMIDLGERVEAAGDLDSRLREMWRGLNRRDAESGDAWLLLEFELWLHAVRDPQLGVVGAERLEFMRAALADAMTRWSSDLGFELPAPAPHLAVQLLALLVGAAFQYRLEPATVTDEIVVGGLLRLLGLAADPHTPSPSPSRSRGAPS